MFQFILALIILDALILAVVVLLQAGQGGGLASLGGGGGTESLLGGGRHTVTWLTKTSWVTGALFLFLSLVLTFLSSNRAVGSSEVQDLLRSAPTPVESPVPAGDQGQVPIPGLGETGTGSQPPANEPADEQ